MLVKGTCQLCLVVFYNWLQWILSTDTFPLYVFLLIRICTQHGGILRNKLLHSNRSCFILSTQKSKTKREDSIEDHQQKTIRSKVGERTRHCSKQRGRKSLVLLHEAASGTALVLDSMVCTFVCLYPKYKHIMYVYTHIDALLSDLLFQNLQLSASPLKSTATTIWLYEKLTWMTGFRHNISNWLNRK